MSASGDNPVLSDATKAFQSPFGGCIGLIVEDEKAPAAALVDGRGEAVSISACDRSAALAADCVWRASPDVYARVLKGARGLMQAYLSGRLDIAGDMGVMARLSFAAS